MRTSLAILIAAILTAGSAMAADIHVAANGSDAYPGTARRPLATLEKARDMARLSSDKAKTILLAPGRYFLTAPLVLDERDSGVTWRGEGKGTLAEIYGGVPVTGWEKWKDGIWRAPVPKGQRFFNLIVDSQSATMAQTPNLGSGYGGGAWKINNGTVGVPKEWRGYDYSDAQVYGFIGGNWFSEMREVLKPVADATGALPVDGGRGDQFGGLNGRIFLRGVLELLDEPGEWCLKHQEGFVYYWPKSGTPMDHLIVRPTGEKAVDVHGTAQEKPARDVTFDNLAFIGSDFSLRWYLFEPNNRNHVADPLRQGMVYGENVERLTVKSCRLLAAGHSGIYLYKYAQNCIIENNLIMGAGYNGINLEGWDMGFGPFKNAAESYVNKGHRIENNFIYGCGLFVGHGCGIQAYQSGDLLISRNEVAQMPRYGISFKGDLWQCVPKTQYGAKVTFDTYLDYVHTRNCKVVGNEIYSVCRNSFDYGCIEGFGTGRDNLWATNDLHDMDQAIEWDGWAHVLFPDDACHWLTISGNIIHHCHGGTYTGAFMLKNIEEKIENNLVVDCKVGRLITFEPYDEPSWDMTIRKNIFAVDAVVDRYGRINEFALNGKPQNKCGEVKVPPGSKGFREVDHNFITPKDPRNPNPLAQYKMDLNSVFAPNLVTRKAPDWDATRSDYRIRQLPGMEFQAGTFAKMGLRPDFPFDQRLATRRTAFDKIQAEDYQRMNNLRTIGGHGIYCTAKGSWAKYANIDFGAGKAAKAIFQIDATAAGKTTETFIRRYGDTVVSATPFAAAPITIIGQWEVSGSYTQAGKTGTELFDVAFDPEKDTRAGIWKPWLAPMTSRQGITTVPGVVDLDIANGEKNANACAYLRSSIHTPIASRNVGLSATCASGIKVWLNGELLIAENRPGTHKTDKAVLNPGWNTVLIKVNQDNAPRSAEQLACDNFKVEFGIATSAWPVACSLPGLPTEEKAKPVNADTLVELRLDSPEGKLLGRLPIGQTTCPVETAAGVHNVYLVFPNSQVKMVDWFKFE
jgi:hypothetical protein